MFHEMGMERLAAANVQQAINKSGGVFNSSLQEMIAAEKGRIASSKTFRQRMLSIKVSCAFACCWCFYLHLSTCTVILWTCMPLCWIAPCSSQKDLLWGCLNCTCTCTQ